MRFARYANTMRLPVTVLGLILLASVMAHGQTEQAPPAEERGPPLCEAAYRGDLQKVRALLRKGVSADTSSRGTTALMSSLQPFIGEPALTMGPPSDRERRAWDQRINNKFRIARLLMASGADVKLTDQYGETALHIATSADGDQKTAADVVRELLRRGAVVDARSLAGFTPLQHAVWNKRFEVAKVLVKAGASLDVRDGHGKSAADELVTQGSQRVLDDLRKLAARPR
jgi:ankyrin repeat protein